MAFISEEEADSLPDPRGEACGSFGELYARTRVPMVRLASFLVASRAEGEELTQDAYLELYRRWDEVENPQAFLRTIVVRRCIRTRSRRSNERRKLEIVGRRDDPYIPHTGEPEVDTTLAAVRRLKPDWRSVVVLRFYTDMSHAEIADVLGCSVATARSRLHRALAELREELS